MYINKFKKIVIKIGSSILIDNKGKPKKKWLKEFIKDIKLLMIETVVIKCVHYIKQKNYNICETLLYL